MNISHLFELVKKGNVEEVSNLGARFTETSLKLIQKAQVGDHYLFHNIRCKCPGDPATRNIGTLAYVIR